MEKRELMWWKLGSCTEMLIVAQLVAAAVLGKNILGTAWCFGVRETVPLPFYKEEQPFSLFHGCWKQLAQGCTISDGNRFWGMVQHWFALCEHVAAQRNNVHLLKSLAKRLQFQTALPKDSMYSEGHLGNIIMALLAMIARDNMAVQVASWF